MLSSLEPRKFVRALWLSLREVLTADLVAGLEEALEEALEAAPVVVMAAAALVVNPAPEAPVSSPRTKLARPQRAMRQEAARSRRHQPEVAVLSLRRQGLAWFQGLGPAMRSASWPVSLGRHGWLL